MPWSKHRCGFENVFIFNKKHLKTLKQKQKNNTQKMFFHVLSGLKLVQKYFNVRKEKKGRPDHNPKLSISCNYILFDYIDGNFFTQVLNNY